MTEYDYIFAGGGAAGLGLAYHLCQSHIPARKLLIIDRDSKDRNDRTWCFWSDRPTPYDHLTYHSWDRIQFIGEGFQRVYDLAPYRYHMIRGIDFYRAMHSTLSNIPEVEFVRGSVEKIEDEPNGAQVISSEGAYLGKWVFNSLVNRSDFTSGPPGYHYLMQHFKGWEIETPVDSFNPEVATLFDFRTPQKGSMRFFYILPFSKRRALIEYTLFSPRLLKGQEYDRALAEYIEKVLGVANYRIESTETGVIPMTDRPFPRRLGKRVMAIGTRGGLVKPSSGYAFLRMQQDSAAIVRAISETGQPFGVRPSPWRYRLFDSIMLQVMYREGDRMKSIFTSLFKNNPIQRIFRFLDEEAPLPENLQLLASLPTAPFLKALIRLKLLGRI
jgi:lycopene beta-cyclase